MKKLCIVIFVAFSTSLFSQKTMSVESFYPTKFKKPANYQSLIFESNGWTFVAEYFLDNKSISTNPSGNSSTTNTIFYTSRNNPDNYVYTKVKGNKLIHYGDRRSIEKIVYIDEHTLIIENKTFRAGKIKQNSSGITEQLYVTTKARTIYKR